MCYLLQCGRVGRWHSCLLNWRLRLRSGSRNPQPTTHIFSSFFTLITSLIDAIEPFHEQKKKREIDLFFDFFIELNQQTKRTDRDFDSTTIDNDDNDGVTSSIVHFLSLLMICFFPFRRWTRAPEKGIVVLFTAIRFAIRVYIYPSIEILLFLLISIILK